MAAALLQVMSSILVGNEEYRGLQFGWMGAFFATGCGPLYGILSSYHLLL